MFYESCHRKEIISLWKFLFLEKVMLIFQLGSTPVPVLQFQWRNLYYRTFYGPILHFLVTFYFIYTIKCDQNKNFSTEPPRCADAHNYLGPILLKWWWNTAMSFDISGPCNICSLTSPCLMDSRTLGVIQNSYLLLLAHTKKLLLVTFCDTTAGIGSVTRQTG